MHAVHLNFFTSAPENLPPDILEGTPALVDLALAVQAAGVRVSVVQSCGHDTRLERAGVSFHFLRPDEGTRTIGSSARFASLLAGLRADVFHVHGFGFHADLDALMRLAPGIPILLQDHASRVPRPWHRGAWRRASRAIAGYSFCALSQAEDFRRAGLLNPGAPVFEIAEASSRFTPGQGGDRDAARAATGLAGDPALLWVGHLNDNKDPLTVLDGIADATAELPNVALWCCYATAPRLERVTRRIADDPRLRGRVHLLGRQPRARIEQLMRAADFFVSGSHREGSGFALIEALACGLPPIATDIESFRVLCGAPTRELLWRPGDARAFTRALLRAAHWRGPELRRRVREHFEREVSYPAIGQRFADAYRVIARARAA